MCLGEYEGELINEETYWTRYPSGVVRGWLPVPYPFIACCMRV